MFVVQSHDKLPQSVTSLPCHICDYDYFISTRAVCISVVLSVELLTLCHHCL